MFTRIMLHPRAGFAGTFEETFDELMDALLDEQASVVSAAVAATTQLLDAGLAADTRTDPGFMLHRVSGRAAMRLAAALGPILEMCGTQPQPAQVIISALHICYRTFSHAHTNPNPTYLPNYKHAATRIPMRVAFIKMHGRFVVLKGCPL